MSLASPSPSARYPLQDQALALLAFLAARDNVITLAQATSALAALPDQPKPAAKELRSRLRAFGIEVQHTHALKAVAEARGASGYLGLDQQLQYDVASWSPDTATITCERVRRTSFAAAADDVCQRVREQFEDDLPYCYLLAEENALTFTGTSAVTGSWWTVLVVPVDSQACVGKFPSGANIARLAERLRRFVEGELGGWLDGMYDVCATAKSSGATRSDQTRHTESSLAEHFAAFALKEEPEGLSAAVPPQELWKSWSRLTQLQWDNFLKRYASFSKRHAHLSLSNWARDQRASASRPRFEPVPINLPLLQQTLEAKNWSWEELKEEFVFDEEGAHVADLRKGKGCLDAIQTAAEALNLDPNELMLHQRSTPRIPLPHHTDLALWLSRMDAAVAQSDGAPAVAPALVNRLQALCSVPYEKRRSWSDRPPAELEALNQEIRFSGLMVCAGMGTRFVDDLPGEYMRPAAISVLEFDWQVDVLTQGGQMPPGESFMTIGPERDAVTPEWLARFNEPKFTASDLMRYSDLVHETIAEEDDEKERFTAKVFAGVKVFNRDPRKAHSASVRMEALSRLVENEPLEPWVRRSRTAPGEEGSLTVAQAAWDATAHCELVDVNGTPGFDRRAFYLLCAKYSRKDI